MRGQNFAENNGNWRGDTVGYSGLHKRIKKCLIKPNQCNKCQKETVKLDLANISQKYKQDLSDWEWICRKCHMDSDGRSEKFKIVNKGRNRLQGRWGIYHNTCKKCKLTLRPHAALGYCDRCYQTL